MAGEKITDKEMTKKEKLMLELGLIDEYGEPVISVDYDTVFSAYIADSNGVITKEMHIMFPRELLYEMPWLRDVGRCLR